MEIKHVKFDYEDVLSGKKQLLILEMKILETLKKIMAYKSLRKQELVSKNKLKTSLKLLKISLETIYSYVPKEDIKMIKEKKSFKKEKKEATNIQEELDEIKKKLDKLE